jgi:arylformamidase
MMLACQWTQHARACRATCDGMRWRFQALHDLDPMRTRLPAGDAGSSRRSRWPNQPGALPAPRQGTLYTVAGAESAEYLRQNRLIQEAWGAAACRCAKRLPGRQPLQRAGCAGGAESRLHQLALDLLRA